MFPCEIITYLYTMKTNKTFIEVRYSLSDEAAQVIDNMQAKFTLKGTKKTKAETLDFILLDYKQKLADKFKIG